MLTLSSPIFHLFFISGGYAWDVKKKPETQKSKGRKGGRVSRKKRHGSLPQIGSLEEMHRPVTNDPVGGIE